MILLDTNVISELWRPKRNIDVERWIDSQPTSTLFVSAITIAELHFGASRLPDGNRKSLLFSVIDKMVTDTFVQRILPFDARCAGAFGQMRAERERLGRPIVFADAAIAATALTYGLSLATRNLRDFEGLGLALIDPFTA
jgi:toxin FitB